MSGRSLIKLILLRPVNIYFLIIKKNTQLETRAEEVRASCEETWKNKVDTLKKEIEDMKKTHEEQMHQLYAKLVRLHLYFACRKNLPASSRGNYSS